MGTIGAYTSHKVGSWELSWHILPAKKAHGNYRGIYFPQGKLVGTIVANASREADAKVIFKCPTTLTIPRYYFFQL